MDGDFRIGDWRIRPQLNRIEGSDGRTKSIEPKAMEVLVYLAQHSKDVLSKERIIQAVWSDSFVTDDVLAHAISELRKAMGDDAKNPRIILTIPKRGYRLLLPVSHEMTGEQSRPRIPVWKHVLPWVIAGLFAVAFLIALWTPWLTPLESGFLPPRRLKVELSPGVKLVVDEGTGPAAVLSPDGSMLAFVGEPEEGGERRIYLRQLDELEATPLPGTEGVRHPVFSPDSQWIAFRSDFKLKKVSVSGGMPVTLCETDYTRGLDWADDDSIIFSDGTPRRLFRASSDSETVEVQSALEQEETMSRWPQLLPGGETVLFTTGTASSEGGLSIVAQRMGSGERKVLWLGGYFARYLSSGHLVFVNQNTLFAVAFDPEYLEMKGQPEPVLENVLTNPVRAKAEFACSEKGTLVFVRSISQEWTLEWLDREGNQHSLLPEPDRYLQFWFSPDRHRLALRMSDGNQSDIWIYEWERGDTPSRLTFHESSERNAVWSPDGGVIVYASPRNGALNLYWRRTDFSGDANRLTESPSDQYPFAWHPSGKYLVFSERNLGKSFDINYIELEGDDRSGWEAGEISTFLSTPFAELGGAFSPDGHWLAYQSNESGDWEVYVRPFPGPGRKWKVSNGGGEYPKWSPNGEELFYYGNGQIHGLRYHVEGEAFVPGKTSIWKEGIQGEYDVHPDGQRLAVRMPAKEETEPVLDSVVFIENFFDYLKEKVPVN